MKEDVIEHRVAVLAASLGYMAINVQSRVRQGVLGATTSLESVSNARLDGMELNVPSNVVQTASTTHVNRTLVTAFPVL